MAIAAAKRCDSGGSVVVIDPGTGDILAIVADDGGAVVDTAHDKLSRQTPSPTSG